MDYIRDGNDVWNWIPDPLHVWIPDTLSNSIRHRNWNPDTLRHNYIDYDADPHWFPDPDGIPDTDWQ